MDARRRVRSGHERSQSHGGPGTARSRTRPASTAAARSSRPADAGSQAADADAQSDADTTGPRASDLIEGLGSDHTPTSGGTTMIVMLSARRLKQGAWEQFRRAWEPGDTMP